MDSAGNTKENHVQVHALQAGHLTLPERFFVHPASPTARRTVPSLAFLIQHTHPQTNKITRILFDLGLRHPTTDYPTPIQKHIETRQPLTTQPDVIQSLASGGLSPSDIDYIIYSHVHWDHIGNPKSFPTSIFIVGPGTFSFLQSNSGSTALRGTHSFFEPDLLPPNRTIEIPATTELPHSNGPNWSCPFKAHPSLPLPRTMDIFNDGSVLIVDAPGHLPGHINLLTRTVAGYVYLGGDTCHDRRLMTGEKAIGEWEDQEGHVCCIHVDRGQAEKTIEMVRGLEGSGVEVIFAHDVEWEERVLRGDQGRFLGSST